MAGHDHTSPGWYPEPDIVPGASETMRYWDGRAWTDRRRPRLILTTLDLGAIDRTPRPRAIEGPIRALELPAPAAEISAAREAPAGRTGAGDQPVDEDALPAERRASSGRDWDGPSEPPSGHGGGGDGPAGNENPGRAGTGAKSRRKWWLLCAIALLGAIAVGLAGQAMKPPSPGPRVLTDQHFVQLANAECAKTMPTLRPVDGGQLGSALNANQAADQIDRAAAGMDGLIDRLGQLPLAAADQPHIAGWLGNWRSFAGTGRDYATFLRLHGANQKNPPAVLDTAAKLARSTDNFARANGLKNCMLAFVYVPDPSQM